MALSPDMTAHAGPGGVKKTPARGRSGTRWRELDRYPSNVLAIFHIRHVDNLPTIISNGLVCDATASTAGVTRVDIGYSQIKTCCYDGSDARNSSARNSPSMVLANCGCTGALLRFRRMKLEPCPERDDSADDPRQHDATMGFMPASLAGRYLIPTIINHLKASRANGNAAIPPRRRLPRRAEPWFGARSKWPAHEAEPNRCTPQPIAGA
jgi:hypothetical protein